MLGAKPVSLIRGADNANCSAALAQRESEKKMFLIGHFTKRGLFHLIEQRETMDEVEAYLRNHNSYGLVVFGQVSRQTTPDVADSDTLNSIFSASEVSA